MRSFRSDFCRLSTALSRTPLALWLCSAGIVIALHACSSGESIRPASSPSNPSYSLAVSALNPASITAGNTSTSAVTLTPGRGYTGSVTLSGLAMSGTNAPACSFSTNPVPVNGNGTSTLTVSTGINKPGGNYHISVTGNDANNLAPSNGAQSLTLTVTAAIQHVV